MSPIEPRPSPAAECLGCFPSCTGSQQITPTSNPEISRLADAGCLVPGYIGTSIRIEAVRLGFSARPHSPRWKLTCKWILAVPPYRLHRATSSTTH